MSRSIFRLLIAVGASCTLLADLPAQASPQNLDAWEKRDTTTYRDEATRVLVTHARGRHYYRDSVIHDYSAVVRSRLDAGIGKRRFIRIPPFLARETVARVRWQSPDDLRVEYLGIRSRSTIGDSDDDLIFDRPWFIPRAVGDSIALLGGDFPEYPALHPFSEQGPEYYRYALHDSITISAPGRTVRALAIRVVPRTNAHSLIAGDVWIDADSHEVVRMTFLFVGTRLWADPDDADFDQREADIANQILSAEADLEYGLFENEFWLPYRQYIGLQVELPWILDVKIPIRFTTEFSDHEVNQLVPMNWSIEWDELLAVSAPDSMPADLGEESRQSAARRHWGGTDYERCLDCGDDPGADPDSHNVAISGFSDGGGRWEIITPPLDTLRAYRWPDELSLELEGADEERIRQTIGELAQLAEGLPADMVGRTTSGIAWREVADIARFNRVQGFSLGAGYRFRPGWDFTDVYLSARFGLGDLRPTATAAIERESPVGRWTIQGFADIAEQDPLSRGQSLGNSLNAFFTGHDDADYYRRFGGGVARSFYRGPLSNITLSVDYEHHESMETEAGSAFRGIYDQSSLAPNPPVAEGDYLRGAAEWRVPTRSRLNVRIQGDFLAGVGSTTDATRVLRGWATVRAPFRIAGRTGALSGFIGTSAGDPVPQTLYRIGGPYTVRSHTYGRRAGDGAWAARLDVALGRNSVLVPVAFFDIGDTFDSVDDTPVYGGGVGVSLLNGWLRTNLSYGINPDDGLKFDLLFGAPR